MATVHASCQGLGEHLPFSAARGVVQPSLDVVETVAADVPSLVHQPPEVVKLSGQCWFGDCCTVIPFGDGVAAVAKVSVFQKVALAKRQVPLGGEHVALACLMIILS